MRFCINPVLEILLTATLNINSVVVKPVKSAKSLGVTPDDELRLVKKVVRARQTSLELLPDPVEAYPTVFIL